MTKWLRSQGRSVARHYSIRGVFQPITTSQPAMRCMHTQTNDRRRQAVWRWIIWATFLLVMGVNRIGESIAGQSQWRQSQQSKRQVLHIELASWLKRSWIERPEKTKKKEKGKSNCSTEGKESTAVEFATVRKCIITRLSAAAGPCMKQSQSLSH